MSPIPSSPNTLPINEELLQLLQATANAQTAWMTTVNHLEAACDEVWLARMWEVEHLENQYRPARTSCFLSEKSDQDLDLSVRPCTLFGRSRAENSARQNSGRLNIRLKYKAALRVSKKPP